MDNDFLNNKIEIEKTNQRIQEYLWKKGYSFNFKNKQ
jgi:hypothetical protein